jgi:hypothetical protein
VEILERRVPDVENPNGPARLIHLAQNSIDSATLAEEETPDLSVPNRLPR